MKMAEMIEKKKKSDFITSAILFPLNTRIFQCKALM